MQKPTNDPNDTDGFSSEESPNASAEGMESKSQVTYVDASATIARAEGELAEGNFQPIDSRYIPAERLASLILFIFVTVGAIVAYFAMWFSGAEQILMISAAIGLTLLCLSLLWNTIFWPPIEYRHIHWKLSDVGLEIRRGVLWKHQIAIPWARAQHADVSQGPLQRMFEIGSLTIHTAGTKNSSVTIDGLAHTRAVELRDEIIRQRKEHDVV